MTNGLDDLMPDLRDRVRAMRAGIEPPPDLWDRIARQTVRRPRIRLPLAAALTFALVGSGVGIGVFLTNGASPVPTLGPAAPSGLADPIASDPFYSERERRFLAGLTTAEQERLQRSAEVRAASARLDSARVAFREAPNPASRESIVQLAEERYFLMVRLVR